MLVKLVRWLIGSRDYRTDGAWADSAASLLTASGADFRKLRREDDALTFSLPMPDCAPAMRLFEKHGIPVQLVREHGLAYLLRRYRRRYGIPIGILLFAVTVFLSEQFIWTIGVTGNDTIPEKVVLERLEELGVGVGTYIHGIDFEWVHNQYLIEHDDTAWIAVNVRGTDALVEVLEMRREAAVPDEASPHNLVAAEDGIVRSMEILRGTPVAEQEMLVREGDLLASGIVENKAGWKLVHARGSVIAEVKRSIRVEVPLETTQKVLSGEEFYERKLKIFGMTLKFFGNTGNIPAECVTIEREHPLRVFGGITLPVSVHEVIYRPYTEVSVSRTEEEARAEAYRRLREECAAMTENAELVWRTVEAGLDGGVYIIACELRVLTEIAREAPIYTD